MSRKQYTEDEVINALRRKNDIRVDYFNKEIKILSDKVLSKTGEVVDNPAKKFDLGNGSWGKIDYLVKVHGYHPYKVVKF